MEAWVGPGYDQISLQVWSCVRKLKTSLDLIMFRDLERVRLYMDSKIYAYNLLLSVLGYIARKIAIAWQERHRERRVRFQKFSFQLLNDVHNM